MQLPTKRKRETISINSVKIISHDSNIKLNLLMNFFYLKLFIEYNTFSCFHLYFSRYSNNNILKIIEIYFFKLYNINVF